MLCDYTSTTFTRWNVLPFVSSHLGHGSVIGCIEAEAEQDGAAVVAIEHVLHPFGCIKKADTSIVCAPRLVVDSGLFVKANEPKMLLFYTWMSASLITRRHCLCFASLYLAGVKVSTLSFAIANASLALSMLLGTVRKFKPFIWFSGLATMCFLPCPHGKACRVAC